MTDQYSTPAPSPLTTTVTHNMQYPSFVLFYSLFLIRSLANHRIYCVHGSLQFFPKCLIHELLTLHGSFPLKQCRSNLDGNMTAVGIIVGSHDHDIIRLQCRHNLLPARVYNGNFSFIRRRHPTTCE